jgi:L-alanine-DL-glutamate epimerase-like enolase superfamily enzyme
VGINTDIDKVVAVIEQEAGATTRFLKIKVNADAEFVARLLQRLATEFPWQGTEKDWVIDANAAWTPTNADEMRSVLAPYRERIYMVEQPWPVKFLTEAVGDFPAWERVKQDYNRELGVLLIADESANTAADVPRLQPFADGVNIKLEKAGGFRGALLAMSQARDAGLTVWSGMMVGSVLASSAAGHLLWLVTEGVDLDGSLLVTPESSRFVGGITWAGRADPRFPFGCIGWPATESSSGIGCQLKAPQD